jgi:hypothetical protein
MRLFVLCLYFSISFFSSFTQHVSGFHKPIIRKISGNCLYAIIWFMSVFVDHLRAPADWFVEVSSLMINKNTHEPNGCI